MSVVNCRPTNGVSFAKKYTLVAQDATDNYVEFDFQVDYNIVANFTLLRATAVIALTGCTITYPSVGVVRITEGGSVTLAAADVLCVVAQRDNVYETV